MTIEDARLIRNERAKVLAQVHDGSRSQEGRWVEDILREPPLCMTGCHVGHLLKAVRGLGDARVKKLLLSTGVDFDRKVGSLTKKERLAVVLNLPHYARKG